MNSPVRKTISQAEARRIISELHITNPDEIDLELIAAAHNILVREEALMGAEARLVRSRTTGVITVRSGLVPLGRKRFAIAHEIGHFFLHPGTRQLALCTDRDMHIWSGHVQTEESEANEFAAELLMPQDLFEPMLPGKVPGFDLIGGLADFFSTTLTASAIQFVKYTRETCVLIVSDGKKRSRFTPSVGFASDFRVREDAAIHPNSCAAEMLQGQKTQSRAADVPAGCWLQGYDPDGKETITEDSVRLGSYGTVLSLIWISDVI